MINFHKILFSIFFTALISYSDSIQAQKLFLKNYTVDDGLPSNEVYQVVQDNDGNLLAATDRGAARFDGYEFEHIPFEKDGATNPVYYIYKSNKGKIFFSGLKGHLFEYRKNRLFQYAFNPLITSLYKHSGLLIANTLSERGDSLWISFNNDYNYNFKIGSCIVTPGGKVVELKKKDGIYFDLQNKFYYKLLSDSANNKSDQPLIINWPDGSVTTDVVDLSWSSGYIRRLYYEKINELDVFCIGRRLLIYKNKKKIKEELYTANILCLSVINNKIFLGFENGGAAQYDISNLKTPQQTYLDGLTVTSIYMDNQKGIWFSTHEKGLFYSYPSKATYKETPGKIKFIKSFKNNVYIGFGTGLIEKYKKGNIQQQIQVPLKSNSNLSEIKFNQYDSLLAITSKGILLKSGNRWNSFKGSESHLMPVSPKLVYEASNSSPELLVYEGLGGKIINRYSLPKRIISMLSDSKGKLWLGTWEGLFSLEGNNLTNLTQENKVFNDRIIGIEELSNKWLVIAGLGSGIALYKDNKILFLDNTNGLPSAVINSLVVDNNDIWLGTNKGFTKVNLLEDDKFHLQYFGIESGLPTIDIHDFTVNEGIIYLKWDDKLSIIKSKDLERRVLPGNTVITRVMVHGITATPGENLSLPHNNNDLDFHFNAVNLAAAKDQVFRYRLEGFHDEWHTTKERHVKYTNLPPGDYNFEVQAYIPYTDFKSVLSTYSLVIHPALWQQWWFPVLIILLLIALLVYYFRHRLKTVKQKNQMLLDLADSQQKALVQLINPHFLFNTLNTVQGAILKEDKLSAASVISRFGKLMRMSMEMSKAKEVSLEKEIELLKRYFELELVRSPEKFRYNINISSSLNPSSLHIPAMLIQPFVENSIKHGVMHKTNNGNITISFSGSGKDLLCTVDDNGIGRKESKKINKKIQPEHQSSGIEITINRLQLLHKEKKSKYLYEIRDKINPKGESEGTTIIFSLPYKENELN